MITTLEHAVTVHDDAEGAIVQNLSVEETQEESELLGMVGDRTQVVRTWTHTERNKFSVTGSGDLTLDTGENLDPQISLLSGGVANINSFKYEQKLKEPSSWTYAGTHFPHATANS